MYAFSRTFRKEQHVRHYTIQNVDTGWEVRADQDSTALQNVHYDDWHRVERAQRRMIEEMEQLTNAGWVEVGGAG